MDLAQEKPDYEFSASIGISQYGKDGTDYETLFKIADGALYIAKEKGKDRFIVYDKEKHGHLLTEDGYCHKRQRVLILCVRLIRWSCQRI